MVRICGSLFGDNSEHKETNGYPTTGFSRQALSLNAGRGKAREIMIVIRYALAILAGGLVAAAACAGEPVPEVKMPAGARLVLDEDWSGGRIDPGRWYVLRRHWGEGNNGVVPENVFLARDTVDGKSRNVLVIRGHGDQYAGPVAGWRGNRTRVGGTIVSRAYFASGRYEVVLKIGSTAASPKGPKDPRRPVGMVPAVWTYAYQWVEAAGADPKVFNRKNPLFNPQLKNEYWSEIDFPEFGKAQDLETGLYNAFLNANMQSRPFSTKAAIDGQYHRFTTIWRTQLVPLPGVTDSQVVEAEGCYWIQDASIPFQLYRGNPLKRLGKDRYAVCAGKEATHFIDGRFAGTNPTHVPAMAAQLNIGVWFPEWGGAAPWEESTISVASVKVWQFDDPGDVRDVLKEQIPDNMDAGGNPLRRGDGQKVRTGAVSKP